VPGAAVAAAIAVLAAIVVPQLVNSPSKPGGTFAAKAAVPGSAAPGRAAPDQSAPAATGTTVTGHPAAVPGPVAAVMEPPVVSSVSPRRGPTAGGNWVVVVGRGFDGISAVDFGASSAVRFIVESPVRLKVSAPAHGAGTVDVVVVGATGRSSISVLDRYRFGP
jgi:hypothetical protein